MQLWFILILARCAIDSSSCMTIVCLLLVNADILALKSGIAANVNMTLQYSGQTLLPYNVGQYTVVVHSVPLVFLTQTKKSMDFFTFILQVM